jgi:hypothetical protein
LVVVAVHSAGVVLVAGVAGALVVAVVAVVVVDSF